MGLARGVSIILWPEGPAQFKSRGQRPGKTVPLHPKPERAAQPAFSICVAPSGLNVWNGEIPRAVPWAGELSCPLGAGAG